jgi:molybdate transport system substrate-binding protein
MLPALSLTPCALRAQAVELHVAAAADLQPVMPTLAAEYERKTGVKVVASFGSSATLAEQLQNGDPQDVFLSADYLYPEKLVAAGLADSKAPTPYARGVLVLWARKDSPAQPLSLDSLTKPAVQKIAVANDLHAPYGMAARRAIRSLGMTEKIAGKLVVGENVAQTAQFALSGNAQAGLISLTIASSQPFREAGTFVRFPATSYPPVIQCGVVLKAAKNLAAAHAFLDWLTSKEVQASLPKFGLDPAE